MFKFSRLVIFLVSFNSYTFGQSCDCESNFIWVKKTFEENDAGFDYALQEKGNQAYQAHNTKILEKARTVKSSTACESLLHEWLRFFRPGHLAIKHVSQRPQAKKSDVDSTLQEVYYLDAEEFRRYVDKKKEMDYEGIWQTGPYKIGIKKDGNQYIGSIMESEVPSWSKGDVKLRFSNAKNQTDAVIYTLDRSRKEYDEVKLIGKKILQIGDFSFTRLYPQVTEQPQIERYVRFVNATGPYIEVLNEKNLYFRIPSFRRSEKKAIDSVITANIDEIQSTENLIIDIRNGTGGSDASYSEILPLLYTNPIRTIGVEFLSTRLNNQRMLDFIHEPEYGMSNDEKEWAKISYDRLEKSIGEFVNLNENSVNITKYDTIHRYPKQVAILINKGNASTDEQFLLAAKQSKKVKLFGTTTAGVLDVSNMYFVSSPCNEFQLGYSLSRSMRIPEFTIDGKGLQPDFYIDSTVENYQWVDFVEEILSHGD